MKTVTQYVTSMKFLSHWLLHRDKLRVPRKQRPHYKRILKKTYKSTGYIPDIFSGDSFNEKLKWLMLFRQSWHQVELADKLTAKQYIHTKLGPDYVPRTYDSASCFSGLDLNSLPSCYVLKCNHDSGSTWIVTTEQQLPDEIAITVDTRLADRYGWNNGEWHYTYIEPKVYAEEHLQYKGGVPPDYKFHCSNGVVLCCQYIYDRFDTITKEIIVGPDASLFGFKLDHNFARGANFVKPTQWDEMIDIATVLSTGEPYVRIDLYLTDQGVRFGEFSWHPMSGNYRGCGQEVLGSLIYLNRRDTTEPIVLN